MVAAALTLGGKEPDLSVPACRVVLMGMMGSGKSTIGRLLAERTGWAYHDNDELLDRLVGQTPAQILASSGEERLREAESEALVLGLESPAPCLVGAAAGTIVEEQNRRVLRRAVVVWLRARVETLLERARGAAHRPWLDDGGQEWMEARIAERSPLYTQVADIILDADEPTPDVLSELILQRLAEHPACRGHLDNEYDRGHEASRWGWGSTG